VSGRERDRYGRKSPRERIGDLIEWFPAHRGASVLLAVIVGGAIVIRLVTPEYLGLPDLRVGDCLFVRTSSAGAVGPDARPAGDPVEVAAVLASDAGERASCGQSHSHEVSAIVPLAEPAGAAYPGQAPLERRVAPACEEAFPGFVGRPLGDSALATMAVVPNERGWQAGQRTAVCLVHDRDLEFLTTPARGSGR
jgi:hypothetical protein